MNPETATASFIVVHIIPATDWDRLTYQRKKQYHYLITTRAKTIVLKPIAAPLACIDVAFVGPQPEAQDSGVLYSLLQDLWAAYPDAEILYADELQERTSPGPAVLVARSLVQHLPEWLQRWLPRCNSLFTLRSLLPLI